MKRLFVTTITILSLTMYSCGSNAGKRTSSNNATQDSNSAANNAQPLSNNTATQDDQLLDTTKLKSDLNEVVNSIASGKPDTIKLKNAASDIMSRDAAVLSDSGIDKMYGNDPAAKQAAGMLKKMRDKMGITPGRLDSIKKAAAELKQGGSH